MLGVGVGVGAGAGAGGKGGLSLYQHGFPQASHFRRRPRLAKGARGPRQSLEAERQDEGRALLLARLERLRAVASSAAETPPPADVCVLPIAFTLWPLLEHSLAFTSTVGWTPASASVVCA